MFFHFISSVFLFILPFFHVFHFFIFSFYFIVPTFFWKNESLTRSAEDVKHGRRTPRWFYHWNHRFTGIRVCRQVYSELWRNLGHEPKPRQDTTSSVRFTQDTHFQMTLGYEGLTAKSLRQTHVLTLHLRVMLPTVSQMKRIHIICCQLSVNKLVCRQRQVKPKCFLLRITNCVVDWGSHSPSGMNLHVAGLPVS